MTDKVQKIRKKVVEMVNSINPFIPDEDGKNSEFESGRLSMATQILQLIDSLQEEPVGNDVLDTVDKKAKKIWNEINTGHEYSIIESYNQFYGICMEIAEMVQEEPASEKKCMFTKDSYTDEDRKILCEYCKEKCEYSKKEEPVSEDLEDAASSFAKKDSKGINNPANFYYTVADKARIFKAGAKWQKAKMMAKAVDSEILEIEDNDCAMCSHTHLEIFIEPNILEKNCLKDNDKVKVIVIKED